MAKNKNTNYSGIPRYSSNYSYKPNSSPYDKPMSIFDAYNSGAFGRSRIDEGVEEGSDEWNKQNEEVQRAKNSRDYMVVDALSKGLRGFGKDIANVGAAYSGGTLQDSTPEQSLWDARNQELIKQGISAEAKNVQGSDAAFNAATAEADIQGKYKDLSSKELALEMDNMKLIMPREYRALYESADLIDNPLLRSAVRGSAAVMLNKYVNGGEVKAPDIVASIIANGGNELADAAQKEGLTVGDYVMKELKGFWDYLKDAGTNLSLNVDLLGKGNKADASSLGGPLESNKDKNKGPWLSDLTQEELEEKYGYHPSIDPVAAYDQFVRDHPDYADIITRLEAGNDEDLNKWKQDHLISDPLARKFPIFKDAREAKKILEYAKLFNRL